MKNEKGGKMKIEFGITGTEIDIPYILNGMSANTMFVLINNLDCGKDSKVIREKNYYNISRCSLPRDLDDFGRCVNAANVFGWNAKDLNKAVQKAEELKLPSKYIDFYKEFLIYKKYFENNNPDIVRNWMLFIHARVD